MTQAKNCSPQCRSFKCANNSVFYRRDSVWCRLTDEPCNVANCTYSLCVKRRLLPQGVCGETVKRKTVEKRLEEVPLEPIKLRGKALRKIGEKDFF